MHKAEEYKEGKYKIREEGKLKYFDIAMITSFFLRQQVDNTPQAIKNMRNNVESAMFQMSCMLRNGKTRYRGKFKNQLWAYCRAMWVNARRITIYMGEVCPYGLPGREIREKLTKKAELLTILTTETGKICCKNFIDVLFSFRCKNFYTFPMVLVSAAQQKF